MAADPANRPTYQRRLIETYMRRNRKSDAAAVSAQLLQEHPDDTDALAFGATILLDQGNFAGAAAQLQRVLQQVPDNPVAHFDLGREYQAQGNNDAARQEFQTAVNLRPDFIRARQFLERIGGQPPNVPERNIGYAYSPGSAAQALPVLQAESAKAPDRVDLLMAVARTATGAGQNDQAIDAYQHVLDRLPSDAPNRSEVCLLMGEAQLRKGDTSAAVDSFKKAGSRTGTILAITALEATGRQSQADQLRAETNIAGEQAHEAPRGFLEDELQFQQRRLKALQSAADRDPEAIRNAENEVAEARRRLSAVSDGSAEWSPVGRVLAEIHTPSDRSLPVHVGDILTLDKIGAAESAVKAIDERLELRIVPTENGSGMALVSVWKRGMVVQPGSRCVHSGSGTAYGEFRW
jgi:Flp pilus assembly protein TadD